MKNLFVLALLVAEAFSVTAHAYTYSSSSSYNSSYSYSRKVTWTIPKSYYSAPAMTHAAPAPAPAKRYACYSCRPALNGYWTPVRNFLWGRNNYYRTPVRNALFGRRWR